MIRVLLVEDHTLFRQSLAFKLNLEPDLTVVSDVASLAEARPWLDKADVVVTALQLADADGVALARELRTVNANATMLFLTGGDDPSLLARAIEAGALGALRKSDSLDRVINGIRRASVGESLFTPREMVELLRLASQEREYRRRVETAFARLTPREWDVLHAIAEGMNDKEIAQHYHLSTETVRTHVVNLLSKLDVDSRLKALVFAIRYGAVKVA